MVGGCRCSPYKAAWGAFGCTASPSIVVRCSRALSAALARFLSRSHPDYEGERLLGAKHRLHYQGRGRKDAQVRTQPQRLFRILKVSYSLSSSLCLPFPSFSFGIAFPAIQPEYNDCDGYVIYSVVLSPFKFIAIIFASLSVVGLLLSDRRLLSTHRPLLFLLQ
mgnify:CR=1 FL=1